MKKLGFAYDLKTFSTNAIELGRVQQAQKSLDRKRSKLDWGVPIDQLPVMEWDDYVDQTQNGRCLVMIAGVVHDVSHFVDSHPGGKAMIKSGIGEDVRRPNLYLSADCTLLTWDRLLLSSMAVSIPIPMLHTIYSLL